MVLKPVMYQKFPSLERCAMCTPKTQDIIQQTKSQQDNTIPAGVAHSSLPLTGIRDKGSHKAKKDSLGMSVWKQTPSVGEVNLSLSP